MPKIKRKSNQKLMPQRANKADRASKSYNLYPFHSLGDGKIFNDYNSLADWIALNRNIKIDGYVGVNWDSIVFSLTEVFENKGLKVNFIRTHDYLKPTPEIDSLVRPFLGQENSVWGKNTDLTLSDFYQIDELKRVNPDPSFDLNIILGIGSSLVPLPWPTVYFDLPKNELLYRMRAGSINNLGSNKIKDASSMYKRFYFIDWIILNKHKQAYLDSFSILVDAQWDECISWIFTVDLFQGIKKMSTSVLRPRPWFDPGIWGGQWMKNHLEDLSSEESNFAWSFEIIAPENGLVFESDGNLLEVSFDTLMFRESNAVLGRNQERFGTYFPIRFDFLDTFDGGNLSIQCHPSLSYIQSEFGEQFTQDETYYIMDCTADAVVYLGFREDINPEEFRNSLNQSFKNETKIEVEKYVQTFQSKKHELFLIPNKTIHSSGKNNMVLEISATPYIFTFKMYDWLQKDDQGNPRPINIDHAFNNLDFERKGERIANEFISKPKVLLSGIDWEIIHLPTHAEHYYDVHRLEFESAISLDTHDECHLMILVEGSSIEIETKDGTLATYNYAETFIIPAAAKNYTLRNLGATKAKVIKAFLKNDIQI